MDLALCLQLSTDGDVDFQARIYVPGAMFLCILDVWTALPSRCALIIFERPLLASYSLPDFSDHISYEKPRSGTSDPPSPIVMIIYVP